MHFGFVKAVWFMACGLPVASQYLRTGVLEAWDGVDVGMVWPLPSGLASDNIK